jgi:murein DD-endopeptidase MepM/ murein hydrolase activator NlpD
VKGYGAAGGGRNDGVNIAAPKGTPIKAAAGGEVVYAGSELAGFGNLILIRHPGGWVTAYGHADTMSVREGDLVKQGQTVGTVGATGNASAPQVHFELRKGKEPVDPAQHLPPL